jgi:uncharacterized membrane protein
MDPQVVQMILIAFAIAVTVRVVLAFIATKFKGWGWYPWIVIACELTLGLLIPPMESFFGITSLVILIVMCFKKRKPKEKEKVDIPSGAPF